MPSITRGLATIGAIATLATGVLLVPAAANAADADLVFTPTYSGPTLGALLHVEEGEGGLADGTTVSFVRWTVVNPTASPVVLTASKAGTSVGAVVEIPAFTEGYVSPDEYALLAGEAMTISVAGVGTISVDRVGAGVDPLGIQTLGDQRAEHFNVFVSGFTAVPAAGGGTDVTFSYRRMAYQPMWLEDLGMSHDASVQLRQYSAAEVGRELNAEASPASLLAETIALGPIGDGPRAGTVTTHIAASPATARTLSLVQVDAFVTEPPADPTLAQGTFAAAAVPPPAGTGTPAAGGGSAAAPAALAESGSDETATVVGLVGGGAALAVGAALIVAARRRPTARA
ncbi:MAG: hypothetical protein ABWY55_00500 [Microbacterium sp.]